MSNQDRLLAMLNQAASSPPVKSSPPPGSFLSSPQSSAQPQTQHLNPPSGAVREPSPLPPPPPISSLSLNDLFKNIGSPPPSQPAASMAGASVGQPPLSSHQAEPPSSGPNNGSGGGNVHQNKLLGMLAGVTANGNSGVDRSKAVSPSGGGLQTPLGSDQQVNLLSMFKSPPMAAHEPVVTHPTSSYQSPPAVTSPPTRQVQPSPPRPHSTGAAMSSAPRPPSVPEATPKSTVPAKSPFDFVSPFDAFDKPPPKPATPVGSTSTRAHEQNRSTPEQKQSQNKHFSIPPAHINGTVIHPGDTAASTKPASSSNSPSSSSKPAQLGQTGSQALSNMSGQAKNTPRPELNLPWQASKSRQNGRGQGPKALQSSNRLDFSTMGDEAVTDSAEMVNTSPMTFMKSENVGFSTGRSVSMTANWFAYALSKGRIRLIDRDSGAKLVLELRKTARNGHIIDMATTPTSIAIVAADSSITVFQVPEQWENDDLSCQEIVYFSPPSASRVLQIEWITKGSAPALAIAFSRGISIVDQPTMTARRNMSLDLLAESPQMSVSGDMIAFCLNQSQSAIAVLTADQLTLFNVSTKNQVWQKSLLTNDATPSSIAFCEANILIGRDNNQIYELVQITADHAILSTITFTAPEPSPADLHYSHAIYDSAQSILWVAAFARGSLFGFRYALKGVPPIKDASARSGSIVAFDQVVEYPLEPVMSMVLRPVPDHEQDNGESSIFYAHPGGFSVANIDNSVTELFGPSPPPPTSVPASRAVSEQQPTPKSVQAEKKDKPVPKAKQTTRTVTQDEKPDVSKLASVPPPPASTETRQPVEAAKSASPSSPELSTLLKQTEDRLVNRFKQNLETQLASLPTGSDSLNGTDLAADISAKVEKQVKVAIQQELKKTLVPAAASAIQEEIRSVAPSSIQSGLSQSLASLPKDIERTLSTTMPRLVGSTIQPAIERVLHDTLKQTLLPALADSSDRLADHITREFKSEMVQIRKDFNAPTETNNDHLLQSLISNMSALQKQVEQLSKASAAAPVPSVQAAPAPPALNVEDTFLSALSEPNHMVALPLVNDFWGVSEFILPMSPDKKPAVSQSVILALLHKLALCAVELNPNDNMMSRVLTWERRVAVHFDTRDPMVVRYGSQVLPIVYSNLDLLIHNLTTRHGGDVATQHVGQVRAIIDTLRSKPAV